MADTIDMLYRSRAEPSTEYGAIVPEMGAAALKANRQVSVAAKGIKIIPLRRDIEMGRRRTASSLFRLFVKIFIIVNCQISQSAVKIVFPGRLVFSDRHPCRLQDRSFLYLAEGLPSAQ